MSVPVQPNRIKLFLEMGVCLLLVSALTTMIHWQMTGHQNEAWATGNAAPRTQEALPPLPAGANLFFVSTDIPSLLVAPTGDTTGLSGQSQTPTRLISWDNGQGQGLHSAAQDEAGHDGGNVAGKLALSPDGQRLLVQTHFGVQPVAWTLDLRQPARPTLTRLTAAGSGLFLGWHPDSQRVLYRADDSDVPDPGLWLVNVTDGTYQRLDIPGLTAPEMLLAAAFSPDGSKLVYATSQGMGFGSEIWLAEADGGNPKQILKDDLTIISSLNWSPDGRQIAFTKIADSPVPFSGAGLWVIPAQGGKPKFLTVMDGGRGQEPLWSQDSQWLFYVTRENYDNVEANYETEQLHSSIRAMKVQDAQESVLVDNIASRQIDLSLTGAEGLVFSSNRAGRQEVWRVDTQGRQLEQLTFDGEGKRWPVLITTPQAQGQSIYLPLITKDEQ
ncbi:MAG: PD40 domain-containing protein [Anaerolineales bacterium]|nr:PD40 domain-containing protein [Anaerolineales bacterium]